MNICFNVFRSSRYHRGTYNATPLFRNYARHHIKIQSMTPRWHRSPTTRAHRYGYRYQHGGNGCATSQRATRALGPDLTDTCCCCALNGDHVNASPAHPAYRYRYRRWHSCHSSNLNDGYQYR